MKNTDLPTIDSPTRVPIALASAYSEVGNWIDNPRAGTFGQSPVHFRSTYSVHYRPHPGVLERHQYAIVSPV